MIFTILGGTGFIGRNVADYLRELGYEVVIAPRDVKSLAAQSLGHVLFAIGLTGGDARERPHDAIDAHVGLLSWVLQNTKYESFLYLSSTRVYASMPPEEPVTEMTPLTVIPNAESLFDLSKLMAESLCDRTHNPYVRIARLSNVYGHGQSKATFLGAVINEVHQTGGVIIHDSPESVKDFIAIEDVCSMLTHIMLHGKHRLYNIASNTNLRCADIAKSIRQAGYHVTFLGSNPPRLFPPISAERIRSEMGGEARSLLTDLPLLLAW